MRWRVRKSYGYKIGEGKYLLAGAVFDATEDEVKGQRFKLELVDDFTMPEGPPRTAPPEPKPEEPPKQRSHAHKQIRMVTEAPETTVI